MAGASSTDSALKRARPALNMTLEEAADALNAITGGATDASLMSAWESGRRRMGKRNRAGLCHLYAERPEVLLVHQDGAATSVLERNGMAVVVKVLAGPQLSRSPPDTPLHLLARPTAPRGSTAVSYSVAKVRRAWCSVAGRRARPRGRWRLSRPSARCPYGTTGVVRSSIGQLRAGEAAVGGYADFADLARDGLRGLLPGRTTPDGSARAAANMCWSNSPKRGGESTTRSNRSFSG